MQRVCPHMLACHGRDSQSDRDFNTLQCMLQAAGAYQLRIGYHLLEGKQVPLKKPLAVMEAQPAGEATEPSAGKQYQVTGLPVVQRRQWCTVDRCFSTRCTVLAPDERTSRHACPRWLRLSEPQPRQYACRWSE